MYGFQHHFAFFTVRISFIQIFSIRITTSGLCCEEDVHFYEGLCHTFAILFTTTFFFERKCEKNSSFAYNKFHLRKCSSGKEKWLAQNFISQYSIYYLFIDTNIFIANDSKLKWKTTYYFNLLATAPIEMVRGFT